jgi:hypothetical protein
MKKNKIKTIYIHPGFWKCGSTFIQRFLQKNQKTLLKHGVFYPCDIESQRFHDCIVPFFSEVGNHILENRKVQAKELLNQVLATEGLYESLILSNEDFLLPSISEHLSFLFEEHKKKFEFKIVIYLRPLIEHVVSSWAQVVSTGSPQIGHYTGSLEGFIESSDFHKNVISYIEPYVSYFGKHNIILKPLEKKQFFQEDFIKDFLLTLGIEDFSEFEFLEKRENQSPDLITLEKLRHFNRFLCKIDVDWLSAVQTKHEIISAQDYRKDFKPIYSLKAPFIHKLKKIYSEVETKIAKDYCGEEKLFFDDYPLNYEDNTYSYSSLTIEDALDVQNWMHIFCYRTMKSDVTALNARLAVLSKEETAKINFPWLLPKVKALAFL